MLAGSRQVNFLRSELKLILLRILVKVQWVVKEVGVDRKVFRTTQMVTTEKEKEKL